MLAGLLAGGWGSRHNAAVMSRGAIQLPRSGALLVVVVALAVGGCAKPVSVVRVDPAVVHQDLSRNVLATGEPSSASQHFLTRADLTARYAKHPAETLAKMHADLPPRGDEDRIFALSELSFLYALRGGGDEYFRAAAIYAYAFLFPDRGAPPPALDPRTRLAANLYNRGLTEGMGDDDEIMVDLSPRSVTLPFGTLDLEAKPGTFEWSGLRLTNFAPAADYEVRGLRNRYRLPGIGAPVAADVERIEPDAPWPPQARNIPPGMKLPVTAFVRLPRLRSALEKGRVRGDLELYTPGENDTVRVAGRTVPLEIEWSSSLAFMLERSNLWEFEWRGFFVGDFRPEEANDQGLMFLQPHRTGRIPVVLVHGTASSPARWAELVNELAADPELRNRIEFWLFLYNTGNPIAYSAGLLRKALSDTIAVIDPEGRDPALRDLVVIGHSQGGLLTKMQVIDSGSIFWDGVSSVPFDEIDLDAESRELLEQSLFFEPLPAVGRVVFIATPHRGSFRATLQIGALVKRLTQAPAKLVGVLPDLLARNPGLRAEQEFERLPSSIDNMNPRDPFMRTLAKLPMAEGVPAHSIIAVRGTGELEKLNDGVVEYSSAHIDDVESELVIRSGHSVQGHPLAISEVARILRVHLGRE
jgi:hypothetical protein